VEKGLAIDPNYSKLLGLQKVVKANLEKDNAVAVDPEERAKFDKLIQWMRD